MCEDAYVWCKMLFINIINKYTWSFNYFNC